MKSVGKNRKPVCPTKYSRGVESSRSTTTQPNMTRLSVAARKIWLLFYISNFYHFFSNRAIFRLLNFLIISRDVAYSMGNFLSFPMVCRFLLWHLRFSRYRRNTEIIHQISRQKYRNFEIPLWPNENEFLKNID